MITPKIYVANLGKYNEGILQGAWFEYPFDMEEISEKIGLNSKYEEYAIHDYDYIPFSVNEYDNIEAINDNIEILYVNDMLDNEENYKIAEKIFEVSDNMDDALCAINTGEYSIHYDCYDMSDVAEKIANELEIEIDEFYIDFEKFGRDLKIGGDIYEQIYDSVLHDEDNVGKNLEEITEIADEEYEKINPSEYAEDLYEDGAIDGKFLIERGYINWNMLGRDLRSEGDFHYIGNGIYIEFHY